LVLHYLHRDDGTQDDLDEDGKIKRTSSFKGTGSRTNSLDTFVNKMMMMMIIIIKLITMTQLLLLLMLCDERVELKGEYSLADKLQENNDRLQNEQ
jgi:hypothetical protein